MHHLVQHRSRFLGHKWHLPTRHLVEDHTQRPDIGGRAHGRLARAHLFGGHVVRRAQSLPSAGQCRLPGNMGNAEVRHLDLPLAVEQDVARFQVPVHQIGMHEIEGRRHLLHDLGCGLQVYTPPPRQQLAETTARHVLHGDVVSAIQHAHIVCADNVLVAQTQHLLTLALETL